MRRQARFVSWILRLQLKEDLRSLYSAFPCPFSTEMIDLMEELKLPRYGLIHFYDEAKATHIQKHERQIIDNLSRAGQRMMGFCKSTFFKRIDSSGFAFLLTVYRHILRNAVFIYAIENKLPLPVGDENSLAIP